MIAGRSTGRSPVRSRLVTNVRTSGVTRSLFETGSADSLKSFGRRRRTKVVDERTRGQQALVYGELGFWPMRGTVRPSSRRAWRVASLRYWGTVRGFLVLEWWWNGSIGSQVTTSDTRGAVGRSAVAAARVWSSPCRVTKQASRLGLADAGAPWANSSGRRSR